ASAGSGFGGADGFTAAVYDVRTPHVPEWITPRVYQSGERPGGQNEPSGGRVHPVDQRCARDRLDGRIGRELTTDADRDRVAVVIPIAEHGDADSGSDAGGDDDAEQEQGDPVGRAGGRPDSGNEQPPEREHAYPGEYPDRGDESRCSRE